MFARRALRRPGIGLVRATAIGAGANAAGSSAAKHAAQEAQALATKPAPGLTDETMEQIRKLGAMKKEGLLTYQEFEAQKQRLLS